MQLARYVAHSAILSPSISTNCSPDFCVKHMHLHNLNKLDPEPNSKMEYTQFIIFIPLQILFRTLTALVIESYLLSYSKVLTIYDRYPLLFHEQMMEIILNKIDSI